MDIWEFGSVVFLIVAKFCFYSGLLEIEFLVVQEIECLVLINTSINPEDAIYFGTNITPWQKAHFVNAFVPQ